MKTTVINVTTCAVSGAITYLVLRGIVYLVTTKGAGQ